MDAELIKWLREDYVKLEKKIDDRFDSLDSKVGDLIIFKSKTNDRALLGSLVLTAIFQLVLAWFQKG